MGTQPLKDLVIVTHDADFLRLDAGGAMHAGIVYCPQRRSLGELNLVRRMVLIWELLEPGEMRGQEEYL